MFWQQYLQNNRKKDNKETNHFLENMEKHEEKQIMSLRVFYSFHQNTLLSD